jgi:adenine/guanine phosphoribosyltransferase-like PRPP-binding protein
MLFKSLANLVEDISVKILPNLPIDIGKVFGIPRSGMIPASIISTLIGAELGIIGEELHFGERSKWIDKKNRSKILLVDDSIRTGKEMGKAINILKSLVSCKTI